jgi:hypothetical protein
MKFNILQFMFILLFLNESQAIKIKQTIYDQAIQNLFNIPATDKYRLPCDGQKNKHHNLLTPFKNSEINLAEILSKNIGKGEDSYFYDYIDPLLKDEIVNEFLRIYTEALKLVGIAGITEDQPGLLSLGQGFVSVENIEILIKEWNWKGFDSAKNFGEAYDYNGDGKLNPLEFTLAMVVQNKHSRLSYTNRCKNCMENIVEKYLKPYFYYIACPGSQTITAQDIWKRLKDLKRPNQGETNIYTCTVGNGPFTADINDFVLKAAPEPHKPELYLEDFVNGILKGYTKRQVDDNSFIFDDSLNMKDLRWGENTLNRIKCNTKWNRDKDKNDSGISIAQAQQDTNNQLKTNNENGSIENTSAVEVTNTEAIENKQDTTKGAENQTANEENKAQTNEETKAHPTVATHTTGKAIQTESLKKEERNVAVAQKRISANANPQLKVIGNNIKRSTQQINSVNTPTRPNDKSLEELYRESKNNKTKGDGKDYAHNSFEDIFKVPIFSRARDKPKGANSSTDAITAKKAPKKTLEELFDDLEHSDEFYWD